MVPSFRQVFFLAVAVVGHSVLGLESPVAGHSAAGPESTGHGVTSEVVSMDSWRRTSVGWERKEDWKYLTVSVARKQLSWQTLIQRTWPATLAATELTLVLAILLMQPNRNEAEAKASN